MAGVEVFFRHERQHRLLVVVRGAGLDPRVTDTDPQDAGVPPAEPRAVDPAAELMAEVVRRLTEEARRVLSDETRANGLLLRGFDSQRKLPSFAERYRLSAAALAVYPMYRGIAHLLGMRVLGRPPDLQGELKLLREHWEGADFFFLHHKDADSAGEDGNRPAKVAAIERLDEAVPDLVALEPDVLVVTGDHATPSQLAAHSWHPVPVLLWGRRCGRDRAEGFGEGWCLHGGLGRHPTKDLMAVVLANAGRLAKYGA